MSDEKEKQDVDPDALLGEGDDDDEDISDPEEFIAAAINEILENGLPCRFTISQSDPFILPLIRRVHRQNEILADISATLRAVAKKMGCEVQSDKALKTADLKQ